MKVITAAEVIRLTEATLGVASDRLFDPEGLGAALRRAAGFLCPCTRRVLVEAVVESFQGLMGDEEPNAVRTQLEDALESIIAYGDLLEEWDIRGEAESAARYGSRRVLLYTAPPSFVWREKAATALVFGIVPDHPTPVEGDLATRIENRGHTRIVRQVPGEDLPAELISLGLVELSPSAWQRAPDAEPAQQYLQSMLHRLQPLHGGIDELQILDPELKVTYYRGRWVEPRDHSGAFIGRRPQRFGNDLWCFVELEHGQPRRWIELPIAGSRVRGCDEAWRIQAAIDMTRGNPQRYRVRPSSAPNSVSVDFFSPVPLWAQRRWDLLGSAAEKQHALFAYEFSTDVFQDEERFLEETLWLRPVSA